MDLIKTIILFIGIFSSISLIRTIIMEMTDQLDIMEEKNVMALASFTSFIWSLFYFIN